MKRVSLKHKPDELPAEAEADTAAVATLPTETEPDTAVVATPRDADCFLTVDHYVREIRSAYQNAVGSIIRAGCLLIEAKEKLPHGEWGLMFDGKSRLPFGQRTAQRLMRIAEHPVLSNPTHESHLPPSWATLSELADLREDELEALLKDGTIDAETERHAVAEIIKKGGALGAYSFSRVTAALKIVITFMDKWPDPTVFVRRAADDIEEVIGFNDLEKLAAWLGALHAGCMASSGSDKDG